LISMRYDSVESSSLSIYIYIYIYVCVCVCVCVCNASSRCVKSWCLLLNIFVKLAMVVASQNV
jgi:hypothetical protein